MPVRTLIVEDQGVVAEALRRLLADQEDIEVIATVHTGTDAISAVEDKEVDLVLMDMNLPGMSGVQATKHIKDLAPHVKVIFVTMFTDDVAVSHAIECGADGYLTKHVDAQTMIGAIRGVMRGGFGTDPRIARGLLDAIGSGRTRLLSERELAVLQALANGQSTAQAARSLDIHEETVKATLKSVFRKLEVKDRTAAIAQVLRRGLID